MRIRYCCVCSLATFRWLGADPALARRTLIRSRLDLHFFISSSIVSSERRKDSLMA